MAESKVFDVKFHFSMSKSPWGQVLSRFGRIGDGFIRVDFSKKLFFSPDQVMGGKSELEADYSDGVFSLSGFVTTENNGGFVRLAHRPKNVESFQFAASAVELTSPHVFLTLPLVTFL